VRARACSRMRVALESTSASAYKRPLTQSVSRVHRFPWREQQQRRRGRVWAIAPLPRGTRQFSRPRLPPLKCPLMTRTFRSEGMGLQTHPWMAIGKSDGGGGRAERGGGKGNRSHRSTCPSHQHVHKHKHNWIHNMDTKHTRTQTHTHSHTHTHTHQRSHFCLWSHDNGDKYPHLRGHATPRHLHARESARVHVGSGE
jgi:hypothetical protein